MAACESNSSATIVNTQDGICNLANFVLTRVISSFKHNKTFCLEGTFSDKTGKALLFLERKAITYDTVKKLISNESVIKKIPDNEFYECVPDPESCGMKAMLIFPATDKHIKKFEIHPFHLIHETPELYDNVTLPYLTSNSFNIQWVYNIIEHKAEQDKIIYEDNDPETGFLLLPDIKWTQKTMENLYVLAIVTPKGVKSLRDLTNQHLPLLRNIKSKGLKTIKEKYGLNEFQLRIYLHYQPSYYHLHVHFTHIEFSAPGIMATKSHLLDTVINNIEMVPDYYQRAVLNFTVKESDSLFLAFKAKGLVKEVPPKPAEESKSVESESKGLDQKEDLLTNTVEQTKCNKEQDN